MTEQLRTYLAEQAKVLDQDVQDALEACGGDPMSALRAMVIANAFLMEENEQLKAQISSGYARRKIKNAGNKG